jgi:RNA polymerase sigma-70 factor, ECF subfamily
METLNRTTVPEAVGAEVRRVLHDFIARRVGDVHTAEDLTQDVLLKAHRSGMKIDELDDVAAWLYRIARNTVIDHYRNRDRHPHQAAIDSRHHDEADPAEDDDREVRQLAECLRPLVTQLQPLYRDALTLTDLGGLTQTEAARQLHLTTSGMKSRVQRARAQLRTALLECCAVHTDAGGRISGYTSPSECCTEDPCT